MRKRIAQVFDYVDVCDDDECGLVRNFSFWDMEGLEDKRIVHTTYHNATWRISGR